MREKPGYIDKKIGIKINLRRTALGLSQKDLANKIGVTFQQVQKYEQGKNRVTLTRLISISNSLNIQIDYFLKDCINTNLESYSHESEGIPFIDTKEATQLIDAYSSIKSSESRKHTLEMIRAISKATQQANKKNKTIHD
jgi:transcriptional regulator with XRE-family HTH domain